MSGSTPSTRRHALLMLLLCGAAAVPATAAVIPDAAEPALIVGADGFGLLAYYDRANGDLKVAHCVDAACSAVTTVTVDSMGDVGGRASLALRPGGLPVISYEDTTNAQLKLALCADPLCTTASTVVIDSGLARLRQNNAAALASDGRPLVAYLTAAAVPGPARLKTAHCEDAGCSTTTVSDVSQAWTSAMALVVAGDGRGMIYFTHSIGPAQNTALLHCADVACTNGSLKSAVPGDPSLGGEVPLLGPALGPVSMEVGADGFVRYAVAYSYTEGPSVKYIRCTDAECTGVLANIATIPAQFGDNALALGASDVAWLVLHANLPTPVLNLVHCLDGNCSAQEPQTCVGGIAFRPSLALDLGGAPLVAFERGANVEVVRPPVTCTPMLGVGDSSALERTPPTQAGEMTFQVSIAPAASTTVQVSYQTVDGTAQAGVDYLPTSGTLTFEPGQPLYRSVDVTILPDSTVEPDETLQLVLSAPVNIAIADDRAVGVIRNDDGPVVPALSAGDCSAVEGDSGTVGCEFELTVSMPTTVPVTVAFQTQNGTATAGDYLPVSGALTFVAGTLSQTVSVSVVGDTAVELDEDFFLNLSSASNATILDGQGRGTIVNDDWSSLSRLELTHGSVVRADLAAAGSLADEDLYRIAQGPYTSWEVVVDEVSGDVAPGLQLQLLREDNSTVARDSVAIGTGSARALRFQRFVATDEVREHVRVRSTSCTTDCGPDDTYRLRAYETTGTIPRFNNAGAQVTVLILQNTTDIFEHAFVHFWDENGVHLGFDGAMLPPHFTEIINTASMPELAGASGSITVLHTLPHGALAGKAVALEPSTGFSFDSPLVFKPR